MNLFDISKVKSKDSNKRECLYCGNKFTTDIRNVKRGWGKCCNKSCAASLKNKYKFMSKSERIREKRNNTLKSLGI
jgi:hypothetical protein